MAGIATPNQLFAELDRIAIAHATITHPPVFTVDEAKVLRGTIEGSHTKNLFLTNKQGRLFLAVTLEDVSVDLKALGPLIGAGRLSFGAPELLRRHLGVEPGSVTPFALINDPTHHVTPVFDQAMLDRERLNFHPLVNTATTGIATRDLLKFAAAQGHSPLILRFPSRLVAV